MMERGHRCHEKRVQKAERRSPCGLGRTSVWVQTETDRLLRKASVRAPVLGWTSEGAKVVGMWGVRIGGTMQAVGHRGMRHKPR